MTFHRALSTCVKHAAICEIIQKHQKLSPWLVLTICTFQDALPETCVLLENCGEIIWTFVWMQYLCTLLQCWAFAKTSCAGPHCFSQINVWIPVIAPRVCPTLCGCVTWFCAHELFQVLTTETFGCVAVRSQIKCLDVPAWQAGALTACEY